MNEKALDDSQYALPGLTCHSVEQSPRHGLNVTNYGHWKYD